MIARGLLVVAVVFALPRATQAQSLEGRWRLVAAEDLTAGGEVFRYPWGRHPVGSIVVERGACYLQIMSGDVAALDAAKPAGDQMKALILSSYIAYTGPCTIDETEKSVTFHVEAAWRPDYVGTVQKRFYRFENGRLLFGPAPNSMKVGDQTLTRRLTLDRAP
jgi:hypothetical protein